jgi:tetratricopeptide (TPR) repeat protein
MTMRKALIIILSIAIVSCTKKLDVPPQDELTPSEIRTEDDVIALLMGGYASLQDPHAFGERYNTLTELLVSDDDLDWQGTFANYTDISTRNQIADNLVIYRMWANAYHTINIANTALSKMSVVSDGLREELEGEARFFRGLVYFQLVNLFAQPYSAGSTSTRPGVPLILEPVEGYDSTRDKLPRASIDEVYNQIVADLTAARSSLPEESENFRATSYSAAAVLSRVYLSLGRYADAADAANEVIESGNYSLARSFADAFNNTSNSSEDVFAIQQSSQSNAGTSNAGLTTMYASDPIGRGEMQITQEHLDKYEPRDSRGDFFYEGSSISGSEGFMTRKYFELYSAISVIRLAELYLTRAETNFRTGQQVGPNTPLQDVNLIRVRVGSIPLTVINSADEIVAERFFELAFEGERFLTVKRLRLTVDGIAYNDPRMVFPIPLREIELGNALPQNEGY